MGKRGKEDLENQTIITLAIENFDEWQELAKKAQKQASELNDTLNRIQEFRPILNTPKNKWLILLQSNQVKGGIIWKTIWVKS